jgi:hypothetical protein
VHGDAGEAGARVSPAELGLDVALEHRLREPAAGVAVIDVEDRFEPVADAAIAR